uniref:C2H2-type domain-containing protein n=1 Tax=Callorhinchus milii TaxID=7868 RepID=A0A4W3HRE3_CALMI
MQLKWLRVLLPKMEDIAGKESFANAASNVSMKSGTGRRQTARKTAGLKKSTLDHSSAKRQHFASNQHLGKNKEPTEICGDFEGYRKDINEMLMFCVKCKDIQQFSFTELQQHCRQNHPEDKPLFVCSQCGFTIDDAEQMNAHAISHEMDNVLNTMQSENKEDQSSIVEGKLPKRRHLKPNTMYCNKCRFSTKDPLQFQKHILRHEEIQYKCGRCERVCYTRGEFQRHSVQHTGTFPFKCRYCDYGAVRKDYVVKHTKGVHRDIIKNGGSVLVLPMRKGSKKKAVSKMKNVLKVKRTAMEQSENSANVGFQNLEGFSLPLGLKSINGSSEMKDLDNAASLEACVNTCDIVSLENSMVENTNILNCSSMEASKVQLKLQTSSNHTVQPGAPLTLVAPAQMVIPSNCLAQLIEIKTVNEKQQLVFKIIPSTAVPMLEANASGVIAKPSQELNNAHIVQPQNRRVLNQSCTLLTNHVDPTNELLQLDPINKIADTKQNRMGLNANFIISRPLSTIDAESVSNKKGVLECRSEDSSKTNGREENLTSIRESSENQLKDEGLAYEQLEKVTEHSNYGKMTSGKGSLTKPFAESVYVTNKTKMIFCNAQIAKDDSCKSFSKAVVSFPSYRTQQNMQLSITSPRTLLTVDKDSELQTKSSTNCTTRAAKNSDKQITPNLCIEQTGFISNKMFHTDYSKKQRLTEQSIGMETCNSSKIHSKCSVALKECSNITQFNSEDCSVKCVNNPYPALELGVNSRNKLYLSVQDSDASKHKQINDSTDKTKSSCNHILTTQAQSQSPKSTADVYANGSSISTFLNELLVPVGDKTENKHSLSLSSMQPAQDSKVSRSQDAAINAEVVPDFRNQCDLIRAETIDDPSVSIQWPIISSVFSLSCGSNDVPEAIRWDNEHENTCSPSNSAQETSIGSNLQTKSDSQFVKNGDGKEYQRNCLFASSEHTVKPVDHFYAIQTKAENVITNSGQKELNKNYHFGEPSQKNPPCVSTCGNIDLNTTSVQLVTMLNGNPFHLHNGSNILAEHSSLQPSLPSPISPVEIDDHSSPCHSQQLPDNVSVYRDVSHISSGYSKKSSSSNVSLGSSVTSSTEGKCATKMDSIVQRIETSDMSDTNVIPLSTVTRNDETNCPSVLGLKTFPLLSSEPGTFQNKVMPRTLSSTVSELGIASVSPNYSDTTLVASMPCGISPCGLKPHKLSSVNPHFTIENQLVMPLSNNSESTTIPNSRGNYFFRNVCSSPEEVQEGKTGVASSSVHGLSLQG